MDIWLSCKYSRPIENRCEVAVKIIESQETTIRGVFVFGYQSEFDCEFIASDNKSRYNWTDFDCWRIL